MAAVNIVDVAAPTAQGYRWQWRTADGAAASTRAFDMFYDCVEDARAKGHDVQLAGAPPDLLGLAQAYAGQKKTHR